MSLKDYTTLVISMLALAVSATSAYRAHFSERLDVSAVLSDDHPAYSFEHGTVTKLAFDTDLLLINSGNKPLAIIDVVLYAFQVDQLRDDETSCDEIRSRAVHSERVALTSFPPLVVASSGVTVVPLHFHANFGSSEEPRLARPGAPERFQPASDDPEGHINLNTCLEVQFTAPNEGVQSRAWYVQHVDGETRGGGEGGAVAGYRDFRDGRAAILVQKARGVF